MTTQFKYNWKGAKDLFVEVTAVGYNPETEELIFPRIQFYPDENSSNAWSMYYDKKEFDTIYRIAYTIFSSTPEQNNLNKTKE